MHRHPLTTARAPGASVTRVQLEADARLLAAAFAATSGT